jgi:hypothetical protein
MADASKPGPCYCGGVSRKDTVTTVGYILFIAMCALMTAAFVMGHSWQGTVIFGAAGLGAIYLYFFD